MLACFSICTAAPCSHRHAPSHRIGDHDLFGIFTRSGVAPFDPSYAKKMYEDRMGHTFYTFDHKGYHFVVLDSIQPTHDRLWEARIDDPQLDWLRDDLKSIAPARQWLSWSTVRWSPDLPRTQSGFGRPQIQHHVRRERSRSPRCLRARKRDCRAAGPHPRQRSIRLQKHAVRHQRGCLRKLVDGAASGPRKASRSSACATAK